MARLKLSSYSALCYSLVVSAFPGRGRVDSDQAARWAAGESLKNGPPNWVRSAGKARTRQNDQAKTGGAKLGSFFTGKPFGKLIGKTPWLRNWGCSVRNAFGAESGTPRRNWLCFFPGAHLGRLSGKNPEPNWLRSARNAFWRSASREQSAPNWVRSVRNACRVAPAQGNT